MNQPFPVPNHLPPKLAQAHAYWSSLLRGEATMPFWDDFKLSDLPALAGDLMLIDVFQKPERFRFNSVGDAVGVRDLDGRFVDEIQTAGPLAFLRSQCVATVEAAQSTYFRQSSDDAAYARLLLPMWGDGRVGMLLGVVERD